MSRRRRIARTFLARLGFAIGRLRPPRARVVLATTHLTTLTGNLRFIEEELRAREPAIPVEIVTLRRGGRFRRFGPLLTTVRAGYHLSSSRVTVVDDYFFPMYVVTPRPGTTPGPGLARGGSVQEFGTSVLDKSFGADPDLISHVLSTPTTARPRLLDVGRADYAEAFGQPRELFTRGSACREPTCSPTAARRARWPSSGCERRTPSRRASG